MASRVDQYRATKLIAAALKESQFNDALLLTHGIRLEALADDGTVTAGQRVRCRRSPANNGARRRLLDTGQHLPWDPVAPCAFRR